MKKIGILHSTTVVVESVKRALDPFSDEYSFYHYVDEGLLHLLMEHGRIDDEVISITAGIFDHAARCGMDGMIVSCSSLSPVLDELKAIPLPAAKIDEAMVSHAVNHHRRIGLVMSNPTTMAPSKALISAVSGVCGRRPEIYPVLVEDAFRMKASGDITGHDRAMVQAVMSIADSVDIILLAQISLDPVKGQLPSSISGKTFSSLDFIGETIKQLS